MAITRIMTMMIANRMIRKYMIIMRKEYYNKNNYNNKTNDNGYNVCIISWSRHLKCRCFEVLKKKTVLEIHINILIAYQHASPAHYSRTPTSSLQ